MKKPDEKRRIAAAWALAALVLLAGRAQAATVTLDPNGAGGNSAWTWTGGSANYTNWLTPNDEDTTYAYASNKNLVHSAALTNTALAGTINSVTAYVRYRESSAIEYFNIVLVDPAGTYISANKTGTASYAQYSEARTTRSDGGAWTWTDINALEAGVKSIANGAWGGSPRVTSVYVVVDYTPNNPPSVTLNNDFAALSSGTITVNYKMIDADASANNLTNNGAVAGVEYSQDGAAWGSDAAMGGGGDGSTGLASSASPGTSHKFAWDSASDLAGVEDNSVYIRMAPNDGFENGSWVAGNAFAIDNKAPAELTQAHLENAAPASGDTSFQIDAAFTEGNPNTNTYDYNLNDAGYTGGSAGAANTADPAPLTFSVSLDGDDKFTAVKCAHVDDIGNSYTSENAAVVYVRPKTPAAPSLANALQTTVDLTINANGETGAGMYYVIRATCAAGTFYVQQSNGALVGAPDMKAGWPAPVTVTGLDAGTEYWFSVLSGNPKDPSPTEGENSATPYGPAAGITTQPPPPAAQERTEISGGLSLLGVSVGSN